MLTIRLFGGPDVRRGRDRVEGLEAPRVQSLLAYLLLHREAPQARAHLAFVLWPESTEPQAKTNLRQLLHHLRRALPDCDRFLAVTARTISWRDGAPFWLDVEAFESAAARAGIATSHEEERAALEEAASRYGGDLLPACYEEWILPERERLRQLHSEVLERLTDLLEEDRDYRAAVHHAEVQLRHDPLRETAYRRLMRLHALTGEHGRALRVYHTCASTLQRELGVEPSRETQEAHRTLLSAEDPPAGLDEAAHTVAAATRFVGRRPEWTRSLQAYREAAAGRAQVLLVEGEAGIGKTRLVEELAVWCARQGHPTAQARFYPADGRLAYGPVVEWLRSDALRSCRGRLDHVWLTELARLLPEVRIDHPELPQRDPSSAAEERQRLFQALTHAILGGARPPLLVLDDLQWCDQETLEFLHFLVRTALETPFLLVVTLRPEEVASDHKVAAFLAGLRHLEVLTTIRLGPLDRVEVGELVSQMLESDLDSDRVSALWDATEGNPLFVVETVRARALRSGAASGEMGTDDDVPPRIHAVIERRLAQLSPAAREVAGLAGLIGREFTYRVLREASGLDEPILVDVLDELWTRRIVREQGATAYDFTHDRIREVAAGTVSPARARVAHRRVAAALENLHADDLDSVSAQIASHYEAAGEVERALAHFRQAAGHAQDVSAIEETATLLSRALTLLHELPPGRGRDQQEVELRVALGVPLVALEGYGGAGVRHVYERAQTLCERLGRPASPPILRGLALSAIVHCELDDAARYGRGLLTAAEVEADQLLEVEGNYVLGVTAFWRGEFATARDHLECAIARYDPTAASTHLALYAQDPKVVCLVRLAYDLWYLGYPERARELRDQALARAELIQHPQTSAYAMTFAAWLANECGEMDDLRRFATAIAAIFDEHPLGFFRPMGPILTGWIAVLDGDHATGITELRAGIAAYQDDQQTLHLTYALALLARAYLLAGDPAVAFDVVRDALDATGRTNQRYLEAELHRLSGACLVAQGDDDGAGAAFDRATHVARRHASPALELRAATARAAHQIQRGGSADAERALSALAAVRDLFTEGDGTADLRAADRLLAGRRARTVAVPPRTVQER